MSMNWTPWRGTGDEGEEPPAANDGPTGPRRSRTLVLVVLGAVIPGAVVGVAALGLGGHHRANTHARVTLRRTTVTRCTLTDSQSFPGQTTFGPATPLPLQAQGLITWLPKAGTTVREGQPLVRVDDRPVILLYGSLPQYRTLQAPTVHTRTTTAGPTESGKPAPAPSTTTVTTIDPPQHGADVRELVRALGRLGYGDGDNESKYMEPAVDAVKMWQTHLGEAATGTVALGDLFYASGPVRVVPGPDGTVGQPMSANALASTSRTRELTATVPDTSTWARVGAKVSFEAGSAQVAAVLSSVTQADSTSSDGGQNLNIVAQTTAQSALAKAGSALTVTHLSARRVGVLCVPSAALVALVEGGYGLQETNGAYVAVVTGLFAQGKVQVSGAELFSGLAVYLPSGD